MIHHTCKFSDWEEKVNAVSLTNYLVLEPVSYNMIYQTKIIIVLQVFNYVFTHTHKQCSRAPVSLHM